MLKGTDEWVVCLLVSLGALTACGLPTSKTRPSGDGPILVGAGDIVECDNPWAEATGKLLDGIAGMVFTLGDNVYESGTAAEFATCYARTWGLHKARTWPSPGNQDYT